MLSGRTQRRALPRHQSEDMKYKYKSIFYLLEWRPNPQPVGFTVTPRAAAPRLASIEYIINRIYYKFVKKIF